MLCGLFLKPTPHDDVAAELGGNSWGSHRVPPSVADGRIDHCHGHVFINDGGSGERWATNGSKLSGSDNSAD